MRLRLVGARHADQSSFLLLIVWEAPMNEKSVSVPEAKKDRRGLLGVITSAAAAALTLGLRPRSAEGATGDPMIVGQFNEATVGNATTLRAHVEGASAFHVENPGGLGSTAVHADGPNGATGLVATSTFGPAVHARSAGGFAVLAQDFNGGWGLSVAGRVQFATAGTDTIVAGTDSKTVTVNGAVSDSTVVLVTLLGDPGLKGKEFGFFVERQPPNQFTIHMKATVPHMLPFGYFVIN
jgi:hypothetical protein